MSLHELHACLPGCGKPITLVMSLQELHACLPICGKPKTLVMSLYELHACLPVCGKPKTLVMSLHELHAYLRETQNTRDVSTGATRLSPGNPKHSWCLYMSYTPISGKPKTLVMSLQELHACLSSLLFLTTTSLNTYFIRVIISRRWVGLAAHIVESTNTQRVLVGKPKVKRLLVKPRYRWENDITMDFVINYYRVL